MFVFDVETLGKSSRSVILSMACVHFDPEEKSDHVQMRKMGFFAKFSVEEQVSNKRTIGVSTLEWWKKQSQKAKEISFNRNPKKDEAFVAGYERMRTWAHSLEKHKQEWVWARGNLDQLVLDDIEEQLGLNPIFRYNRWRDVRTGIDFLYNTNTGYAEIEYPTFDEMKIVEHDPMDDCIRDAMMLMYGKRKD